MPLITTYGVHIREKDYGKALKDTVEVYRKPVDFLISVRLEEKEVFQETEVDYDFADDQNDMEDFEREIEAQEDESQYSQIDEYEERRFKRAKSDERKVIVVNSFVQHRRFGVGVVKKISGPSFARIAKISFLSSVGDVDLPIDDPELTLVAVGRKGAR